MQQDFNRYQRQMMLPQWGQEAQQKLANASVLVIGAGGLGCPILQYLVAAGVSTIGIADHDVVEETNLHRQVLYSMDDIGLQKAEVAMHKLKRMNPSVAFICYPFRWQQAHCLQYFPLFDVVVDATDNFTARYTINDACVLMNKLLVYGAVSGWQGQVGVFNAALPNGKRSAHYRHLFPVPPMQGEVQNCATAGVVGVLPGIVGAMQAAEVIKTITGIGKPLINQVLTYQLHTQQVFTFAINANNHIGDTMPMDTVSFLQYDYEMFCGECQLMDVEIDGHQLQQLMQQKTVLVDLRDDAENPRLSAWAHQSIPLGALHLHWDAWQQSTVVFICRHGFSSLSAVAQMKQAFPKATAYSVKGGVTALVENGTIIY